MVTKIAGPVTYEVHCGRCQNQQKVLHVNHLKLWHDPEPQTPTVEWSNAYPSPLSARELPWTAYSEGFTSKEQPPLAAKLTPRQRQDVRPGWITAVWHVINTPLGHVVNPLCPIPRKQWDKVNQEVTNML